MSKCSVDNSCIGGGGGGGGSGGEGSDFFGLLLD